ncbi:MAG: hypothetical protein WC796_05695 [Candidatus Pacearchaeota archaeon]|jgi:hypothetical protein
MECQLRRYALVQDKGIFMGPDEDTPNIHDVAEVLDAAYSEGLRENQRVLLSVCFRDDDFDVDSPSWQRRGFSMSVRELSALYRHIRGYNYKPNSRLVLKNVVPSRLPSDNFQFGNNRGRYREHPLPREYRKRVFVPRRSGNRS